jgi:hypothetical protein
METVPIRATHKCGKYCGDTYRWRAYLNPNHSNMEVSCTSTYRLGIVGEDYTAKYYDYSVARIFDRKKRVIAESKEFLENVRKQLYDRISSNNWDQLDIDENIGIVYIDTNRSGTRPCAKSGTIINTSIPVGTFSANIIDVVLFDDVKGNITVIFEPGSGLERKIILVWDKPVATLSETLTKAMPILEDMEHQKYLPGTYFEDNGDFISFYNHSIYEVSIDKKTHTIRCIIE